MEAFGIAPCCGGVTADPHWVPLDVQWCSQDQPEAWLKSLFRANEQEQNVFFAHCQKNHFVFRRGFIKQKSGNYQQSFRIFDADAGTVIFSLSQDTVNWSHFGPTYVFLNSAQQFIIKNHQLRMACQVIITEEVKAFFCTVSPAAFRAVYNCIFSACYLGSACILERDWNIFWFQLLITTKLLSMNCPLWRGNPGREYNRTWSLFWLHIFWKIKEHFVREEWSMY